MIFFSEPQFFDAITAEFAKFTLKVLILYESSRLGKFTLTITFLVISMFKNVARGTLVVVTLVAASPKIYVYANILIKVV
jgi:hypothetical protein